MKTGDRVRSIHPLSRGRTGEIIGSYDSPKKGILWVVEWVDGKVRAIEGKFLRLYNSKPEKVELECICTNFLVGVTKGCPYHNR